MTALTLTSVPGTDLGMASSLAASDLPISDLQLADRSFFVATNQDGDIVGYCGIEVCGDDLLLRSVVILPKYREQHLGALLVQETLASIAENSPVYLATTSAAPFFAKLGFATIDRLDVPATIMATRQLSTICPASATIMKLTRPPS